MGFAPLPFDPRSPCFCRQNCPSFRQPTSRWWCVWTTPPPAIPELGDGVLVEFVGPGPLARSCQFDAVVLPPLVTLLFYRTVPILPIPGVEIRRRVDVRTSVGNSFAANNLSNEECDIPLNIPGLVGASPFGSVNIFPVRWYENANDVPH